MELSNKNEGKVIYMVPSHGSYLRAYRRNFNWFAPMFYVSLSFNIIMALALLLK